MSQEEPTTFAQEPVVEPVSAQTTQLEALMTAVEQDPETREKVLAAILADEVEELLEGDTEEGDELDEEEEGEDVEDDNITDEGVVLQPMKQSMMGRDIEKRYHEVRSALPLDRSLVLLFREPLRALFSPDNKWPVEQAQQALVSHLVLIQKEAQALALDDASKERLATLKQAIQDSMYDDFAQVYMALHRARLLDERALHCLTFLDPISTRGAKPNRREFQEREPDQPEPWQQTGIEKKMMQQEILKERR